MANRPRRRWPVELREELGIELQSARFFQNIRHDYTEHPVSVDFFLVDRWKGQPVGAEGQQIRWIERQALEEASLLPADAPVVAALAGGRACP